MPPGGPDAKIWRYLSFSKLIDLLHRSALFFTVADRLEDKHEGTLPWANLRAWDPTLAADFDHIRATTAVNCWHLGEQESAAMWRIYAGSGEGVAVQSTVGRLVKCFRWEGGVAEDTVLVGQVNYIDFEQDMIEGLNVLAALIHKRSYFDYERELRAVYLPRPGGLTSAALEQRARDGQYLPVDLGILIEKIYVAPTSSDWFYDLLRGISNDRYPIVFSRLDDMPGTPDEPRQRARTFFAYPGVLGGLSPEVRKQIEQHLKKGGTPEEKQQDS